MSTLSKNYYVDEKMTKTVPNLLKQIVEEELMSNFIECLAHIDKDYGRVEPAVLGF